MIEFLIETTVFAATGGLAGFQLGRVYADTHPSKVQPTTPKCSHPSVRFDTHGQDHNVLRYHGYCTRCGAAYTEVLPMHDWENKAYAKKHRTRRIRLAMEARGWLRDDSEDDSAEEHPDEVYYR